MVTSVSLLRPLGYQRSKRCGYCKTTEGNSSYYLGCDNMRIDHYQELMNRGWRRSGTTYYKPDLTRSCCPHYTIRLKADAFVPKKSQRQSINRWNGHILGISYKGKAAMLCPVSREHKKRTRDRFDLVAAVHQSEYQNVPRPVGKKSGLPIEPEHKFEVNLEPAKFSKEKHSVFLKYQVEVHRDPPGRWRPEAFKRFLCDGLEIQSTSSANGPTKLGSYHQCYRLDGRLVAVGVLDLLPRAVSSVYLFYDPEFQDWEFGKMSALREIALAIEGQYEWYYMGYYIHSCAKMRYKGTYEPSYLLDPETLGWNELDDHLRRKLSLRKYVCPSQESDDTDLFSDDLQEPSASKSMTTSLQTREGDEQVTLTKPEQIDPNDYDIDSDPSDAEDNDMPEGSLFDYNIPGMLNKSEVAKLDLNHWKLLIRSSLVDFEDIRGWNQQRIDDPSSIKGIVAELAAATGPQLLQNSAVKIF